MSHKQNSLGRGSFTSFRDLDKGTEECQTNAMKSIHISKMGRPKCSVCNSVSTFILSFRDSDKLGKTGFDSRPTPTDQLWSCDNCVAPAIAILLKRNDLQGQGAVSGSTS